MVKFYRVKLERVITTTVILYEYSFNIDMLNSNYDVYFSLD